MAYWQPNSITSINIGQPNDGTGDSIRTAFSKVDDNFQGISTFLISEVVDFSSANIAVALRAGNITTYSATLAGVLQLANVSTAQRNTMAITNGALIYNNTYNKFQGYANGSWGNITLS